MPVFSLAPRRTKVAQEIQTDGKWKFCSNASTQVAHQEQSRRNAPEGIALGDSSPKWHWQQTAAKALAELSARHDVHTEADNAMEIGIDRTCDRNLCHGEERKEAAGGPDLGSLFATIGQQTMEIDVLLVALGRMDDASAKK